MVAGFEADWERRAFDPRFDVGLVWSNVHSRGQIARVIDSAQATLRIQHTKLILVDEQAAMTGSMNIDRSAFDLRRELGIGVDAPDVIARLSETFNADWEAAKKYSAPDPLDPAYHEEGELPPDPHFVHD